MIKTELKPEATRLLSGRVDEVLHELSRLPDNEPRELWDTLHHVEKIGRCRRAVIAATLIKTLSRAVQVRDWLFQNELRMVSEDGSPVDVGMRYVPAKVRFKGPEGEELPARPTRPVRGSKALPAPGLTLMLEDGE